MDFYTEYTCKSCGKYMVLDTEETGKFIKHGKYLKCPYCNSKRLHMANRYESIKECFKNKEKR